MDVGWFIYLFISPYYFSKVVKKWHAVFFKALIFAKSFVAPKKHGFIQS